MSLPRVLQDLFFFFYDFSLILHLYFLTSLLVLALLILIENLNAFLFEELKKRNLCNNNSEKVLP